jgi:hypothetical protein
LSGDAGYWGTKAFEKLLPNLSSLRKPPCARRRTLKVNLEILVETTLPLKEKEQSRNSLLGEIV